MHLLSGLCHTLLPTGAVCRAARDPTTGEYLFERDPVIFTLILEYLRTGSLNVPAHVSETFVNAELSFWGLAATNQPVRSP